MVTNLIRKSLKLGIIGMGLFSLALVLMLLFDIDNSLWSMLTMGIMVLIAEILGMIGLVHLIKGRKETKNSSFVFATLLNGLIDCFIVFHLITIIQILPKLI